MINKETLQPIFEQQYERKQWLEVMKAMFGEIDIYAKPPKITLAKNDWDAEGFVLGRFDTADKKVVGIYEVTIGNKVKLEKNRVSLRKLLKSIYENDVDAALIVFNQKAKWRFSYVSEIRIRNKVTNKVEKQATDPKRYTYVFGKKGLYRTPILRFQKITPGFTYLQDIAKAFSVSELNEEFYGDIVSFFYQLTGANIGKGRNKIVYNAVVQLPGTPPANKKIYQEFAVRLIGRIIFCWFLKFKKSDKGIPLLPDELLSSAAVKGNYYHSILELLFFQVLNTPQDKRKKNLPQGSGWIPFLNGGLFEAHDHDFYKADSLGFSKNTNTLQIPDQWFIDFFTKLEQYNFTIDENSIEDAEVSIDPEMLGRIFENLLAEIDPDTGESARKATGSFYTPREIVNYMVGESLTQFLHNHTQIDKTRLYGLFDLNEQVAISDAPQPDVIVFSKSEANTILKELDKIKIFDPACGSGAFPIGALQKLVLALEKLDKDAHWWKESQLEKIPNALLKKQLKKKLDTATVDYTRKLGLIQNNIYGVDIQPIAAEISKLRCFLTLVVDEQIDDDKENRGVEPLPNLEFKFIAANTLYRLPDDFQADLFGTNDGLSQLQSLRRDYLQAFGEEKDELKKKFRKLQTQIFKQETKHNKSTETRSMKLAAWNPFSDDYTPWFDADWMYGVSQFDIVIGNPPYGGDKIEDTLKTELGLGSKDPYGAFMARFIQRPTVKTPLRPNGVLSFIVSDTFMTIKTHLPLRELLMSNVVHKMIRVHPDTFKATVNTAVILAERHENLNTKSQPVTGQLLACDLTRISIHEEHQEFLRLLRKTVSYTTPLKPKQESKTEDSILYMQGACLLLDKKAGHWTSESCEEYAIYVYPQEFLKVNSNIPFFVASPKLFVILDQKSSTVLQKKFKNKMLDFSSLKLNDKEVDLISLGQIAEVNQGISTGDNKYYLRRTEEGEGYQKIDINSVIGDLDISRFTDSEKMNGIDKKKYNNRYYIPFDKGADSDTEEGWMPNYFVKYQYYIDWSIEAVNRMKTLTIADRKRENDEKISVGDEKKIAAALRNRDKWFMPSINFSPTGYYSPTFRLGPGTISQNTSSTIILDKEIELYCLGILCSKFAKYFLKNYHNHTVHTQEGDVILFPLALYETMQIENLVSKIIKRQEVNPSYNYAEKEQKEIDTLVFEAYGLDNYDIQEVENWYARRYPKLVAAQRENLKKKEAKTKN